MDALDRTLASGPRLAAMPVHERARILRAVSDAIGKQREAFASLIVEEVGKPLKAARGEVERAVFNFQWAAGEAERFGGEWMPLDVDAGGEGRMALVRRFPRGACLFITPFNFPLNLAVHKIAPAMAVGAPFVLKPAPQAPKTAKRLGDIIKEAGWPEEGFAVHVCSNQEAETLVMDDRFAVLSFTGSADVGWKLKALNPRRHVVLELGGNASVIIAEDADLPLAAARCAAGAFVYSGQICISTQRILAAEPVYEEFKKLLLENVAELVVGEPADEKTDLGPMINEAAAIRVEQWIDEAKAAGASVLCGGTRDGSVIGPTVVEMAPADSKLICEEVFGPVATLEKIPGIEHGLLEISKSRYGLQAGIFTRDIERVLGAWEQLDVGGLMVNDVPTYRSDLMPYGGNKESGTGREGVRWAMQEYTQTRTLILKP
ncbi:MAG: aldehyde dehydrogenase [Elusimicrobia bacterium]|nr:MAG: aldehyde dehydrogenase [Elusimicrobiota bacterium]